MRILLVLGASLPTQNVLWEDAAELGSDIHVAYTLDALSTILDLQGPPTFGAAHELPARRMRGNRLTWLRYEGLAPTILRVQPDIVHVLNEPWALTVGQVLSAGVGRVVTHGCEKLRDQGSLPERSLRRAMTRRNLRRSSGFVSYNQQGVSWARRRGLPTASPTAVLSAELPNLNRFEHAAVRRGPARKRFGVDGSFVMGYVGRLVPEKWIEWLLESWSTVELPVDARLVFVGAGPLEPTIREAAGRDDRIRLHEQVPFADVPDVTAMLDALVLPSLTTPKWCEQYGRVITGAMASGVAVIASDSGAIPQVVGDAGVLVPEGSVSALAEAMRHVANDGDWRDRLVNAGLERARTEFSPAIRARELLTFWEDVMETAPRG